MQSDGNSLDGGVVLNSINIAYKKRKCFQIFIMKILKF